MEASYHFLDDNVNVVSQVDENKKLFFHMTEVEDAEVLQTGDEVEFVVVRFREIGARHRSFDVAKAFRIFAPADSLQSDDVELVREA